MCAPTNVAGVELCHGSIDYDELSAEVRRVRQAAKDDVALVHAQEETHWGEMLTPRLREVAMTTHRLKQSLLFRQEWERFTTWIFRLGIYFSK